MLRFKPRWLSGVTSTTSRRNASFSSSRLTHSSRYCLSNGLCLTDLRVTRGSCTDTSWDAPECAAVCRDSHGWEGDVVRDCGYSNGLWACGSCAESNFTMAASLVVPAAQKAAIMSAAHNASAPSSTAAAATATASSDASAPSSPGGPNWTLVCGIVSGLLGVAQLVSLFVIAYQRGRIMHLRNHTKQQERRLEGPWTNHAGGTDGRHGAGANALGGAPRGFGWGAGDGIHESHPWANYYQHPISEAAGAQRSPHDHSCPGCNISPSSAEATRASRTEPRGWYAVDAKHAGGGYHEMDTKEHGALEKELTLAPVEKDCTPPRKKPFERKWFTFRAPT